MFKLSLKPTFTAPVSGTLPGGFKFSFDIEFDRLTQDEIAELAKGNDRAELVFSDICKRIVVGWKNVQDENGDIEFSSSALDQVLAIYPMSKIIFDTWQASLGDARTKN
jgi:hypothetical protein